MKLKESGDIRDYESVWKWFFFHYIYNGIKENSTEFFEDDKSWKLFKKCIQCVDLTEDPFLKGISRFLSHIKKGQVKISQSGYAIDLGYELTSGDKVNSAELVHKTEQMFGNLIPVGNKKLYLLVDELEISYEVKRQYERDVRIIRDPDAITEKMNYPSRRNNLPVYIIGPIRSEVVNAANVTGKEINKCVEDFGISVVWYQPGGDEHNHPLIQMIMKRLVAAEKLKDNTENRENVWQKYFPDKMIQDLTAEQYILHNFWDRPRDIVRMFSKVQTSFPNKKYFDHQVFDVIRKTYSEDSWTECMEKLKANYNNDQIIAMKNIFSGWERHFSQEDFVKRVNPLSNCDERVRSLGRNYNRVLDDLYRFGVIGNRYKQSNGYKYKIRFVFRGDNELLSDYNIMIHNALKPYFSL